MKQPIFVVSKSSVLEAVEICRKRYAASYMWGYLRDPDKVQGALMSLFDSSDRIRPNKAHDAIEELRLNTLLIGTDSALDRLCRLLNEKKEVE